MKNTLFKLLAVLAAASMLAATVSAQPLADTRAQSGLRVADQQPQIAEVAELQRVGEVVGEIKGATEPAIYIIHLEDSAVPSYTGGTANLRATMPALSGAVKLDAADPNVVAYRSYLADKQALFVSNVQASLERAVDVKFQYQFAINGLAVELTPDEAARVAAMRGVKLVVREWTEYAQTDAGPAWINAEEIWDGTATGDAGTFGEGIVVGILDTGINTDHPSFAATGDDGYAHTNPLGTGNYLGWCDPANVNIYDPNLACNDKLIGMWSFDADSPEDANGHGSHVGSTSAGNFLEAEKVANTTVITREISGVAPHANVIGYSIEGTLGGGSAPGANILAATEQAIIDGVDVINYSFGGGAGDPWSNALHWLNVRDAGIFVATSAGNDGPDPATVGSPGNAPWMITVANSTHNRKILNSLVDMVGGDSPPADILGKGVTTGYGPAPIVYAAWYPNANDPTGDPAQCLEPYPAGTFSGEIVVCDRGTIARVDKGWNVLAGGAGGLVLANTAAEAASIVGDDHYLPAVHITYADGVTLKTWLTNTVVQSATITGALLDVNDAYGDIMTASSSRGPNFVADLVKPDIAAPGQDILAAVATNLADPAGYPEYDFYTGTSMSSPHVAGAAALLRAVHPTWTVAEIQSALMSTSLSTSNLLKEDGITPTDPFDVGSGRVDAALAVNAVLVMDETTANFEAANPAVGGDPKTLNMASFANDQCVQTCSWTRVLSSTAEIPTAWQASTSGPAGLDITVTPDIFTIPGGGTQVITVEVDVSALDADEWYFGEVTLSPMTVRQADAPVTPDQHFPLAVIPSLGNLPASVDINTRRDAGSKLLQDLTAVEITDLTVDLYGLQPGDVTELSLMQDSDNSDAYDNLTDGVYYMTATVPSGAARFIAEILDSTAPDVDLRVGLDANANGMPDEAEELCASTTPSWNEYCELTEPAAGDYWVLVQNWEGSASQPDDITLSVAVVAGDAANLTVEGPTSVLGGEPFDIRVYWNEPTLEAGDVWYGAIALGTDGMHAGNLGLIPLTLYRWADDVTKTASSTWAPAGGVVDYTITVASDVTGDEPTYTLTDTIPAGLTYVTGSADATQGTVDDSAAPVLTWTGVAPSSVKALVPGSVTGYVALSQFVPPAVCSLNCDETILTVTGLDFYYHGVHYDQMKMISNGFIVPGDTILGTDVLWLNQLLPDAADPNGAIAPWWTDLDMDGGNGVGGGIWYIAGLTDNVNNYTVLEWENAEMWDDDTSYYTFQIWIVDGTDQIWFTYDHLTGYLDYATVGFEDMAGATGDTYYYADTVNTTGTLPVSGVDLIIDDVVTNVEITYQAQVGDVAPETILTNEVDHITDNPGALEAMTSYDLLVGHRLMLPLVQR